MNDQSPTHNPEDISSPKRFLACLKRSGIVTDDQFNDSLSQLKNRQPGNKMSAEEVANYFVNADLITEWQSAKLLRGRYKGFFLGKYRLLGHLGTGGMSTVYLAEHNLTGQKRAIKVLPRDKINERSYLTRFYREARSVAALNHPNIVRIYDVASEDQTHYMVMEHVHGHDLYNLVEKHGQLDFDLVRSCIRQAATGLAHAHENNFVHRDIKPANLLLNKNQQVKILDLGLALLKAKGGNFGLSVRHNEKMMGTADYLAPEQAVNSHNVDRRADIYSLGCTLYYLLTGQPPFPEGTLAQRIAAHQSQSPTPINQLRADCSNDLQFICQGMMQKKPAERFQNCEAVISALDGQYVVATQQPKPTPTKQPLRKRKSNTPIVLMLGALILFVTVLALSLIFKPSQVGNETASTSDQSSETTSIDRPDTIEQSAITTRQENSPSSSRIEASETTEQPVRGELPFIGGSDPTLLVDFEDVAQFPSRRDQWDLKSGNTIYGTLFNRGRCKVVDSPENADGITGKCLLLRGNSKHVEFRPVDPESSIGAIRFAAIRQSDGSPFAFEVEAKSNEQFEKWKTIYVATDDFYENQPTQIVIGSEIFNTIDARKFRFRLEGGFSEGVFIDNLAIELQ